MPPRRSRPAACVRALLLALGLALGACGDAGDDADRADPIDTTPSTGAPVQGDPSGANTGAGGDGGGGGAAVDPGTSAP